MCNQLPERTSTISGTIVAFQNVAAALCSLFTGFIIQSAGGENIIQGFQYSFLMISSFMVVVAILFIGFVHPDRKEKKVKLVDTEKAVSGS